MRNVRMDTSGEMRCWNCGSKGFTEKRTMRSKMTMGVGALLTKKKLKCQTCGEYNDTGNAQPWQGPAARKYRKQYEAEMKVAGLTPAPIEAAEAPDPEPAPEAAGSLADELAKLAALRDAGILTDEEFAAQKAKLLS